jgi:hypothetical protein
MSEGVLGGVSDAAFRVLQATSTPTPKTPNPDLVTPGVWGFIVIFLIAVVTILLVVDMTRRVRRTRYRAEVNAKLDAEEAASSQASASSSSSSDER